jgi:hypothetical protein
MELIARIEREEAEEALDARVTAAVEAAVAIERARFAEKAAPVPKRSEMTALAKSRYIREHGRDKYMALPWK